LIGAPDATATERSYVTHVLGRAVLGGVRDALRGQRGALARVAMVLAGLGVTSIGYAQARASALRRSLSGRP
jgi:hypothetical protein